MVLTPKLLWKDFTLDESPLEATVFSKEETKLYYKETVYYNGEKSCSQVTRIFSVFFSPKKAVFEKQKCVLVLLDILQEITSFDPSPFLSRGFCVLVVDYSGDTKAKQNFTIYPKQLEWANFISEDSLLKSVSNPIKSPYYIWTRIALRAVSFIKDKKISDIFVFGVSEGGSIAIRLLYNCPFIKAGSTLFSGGFNENTVDIEEDDQLSFDTALCASAYAKSIEMPVLLQAATNEPNDGLSRVNKLFEAFEDKNCFLSIFDYGGVTVSLPTVAKCANFFILASSNFTFPKRPKLSVKAKKGELLFLIELDEKHECKSAVFKISHTQKSEFRFWKKAPTVMVSENEYFSSVSVFSVSDALYAFALCEYESGFSISSEIFEIIPSSLGIVRGDEKIERRIYDSDMGIDNWSLGCSEEGGELLLEKGPFDLEGVTSTNGHMCSYQLGDPMYRGDEDASLSITVFSPLSQTVVFSVCSERGEKFIASAVCSGGESWQKISLVPHDFRGDSGQLPSWAAVKIFNIKSVSALLVHSLLWV